MCFYIVGIVFSEMSFSHKKNVYDFLLSMFEEIPWID